jgi:glycerophosphoryl diester phosphodiesterase
MRAIIIGHRGAAGHRPEHTAGSYELAVAMGADWIEPDLVPTKDHVLVVRHENDISSTTDVSRRPEFAGRRTTKVIDGLEVTGWFTEDFTLAELKTLRAVERLPELRRRATVYDGVHEVMTFQEVLDLAERLSLRHGREVGVFPETKHPPTSGRSDCRWRSRSSRRSPAAGRSGSSSSRSSPPACAGWPRSCGCRSGRRSARRAGRTTWRSRGIRRPTPT